MLGKFHQRSQPAPSVKISQLLFNSAFSKKVRDAVLETKFFKGMINNSLSPDKYGGYMVQDGAFTYGSINALNIAAARMQGKPPPDFSLYYRGRAEAYSRYNRRYTVPKWRLLSSESVFMGAAVATYVASRMELATEKPRYLCMSLLAGELLLPWVAKKIDPLVPENYVYRAWVDNNNNNYHTTADFVNRMFDESNMATYKEFFDHAMINELNFYRAACGEHVVSYEL